MKRVILFALLILYAIPALSQEYQTHFPKEEFQDRRNKLFDQIGDNAIAIIQGAPDPGGYIFPRQTNTFYYLSGVENSYSYLLLDGRDRSTTLYMPSTRASERDNVLSLASPEKVIEMTGVDKVVDVAELRNFRAPVIYTPFSPGEGQGQSRGELNGANRTIASDYWDGRPSREGNFVSLLMSRNTRSEIKNLTPILDDLRDIKSPLEIDLLRRAGQLAALALAEAVRSTAAGVYEYQLDAVAKYTFMVNGARLDGYRPITAGGVDNIIDAHYYYDSAPLKNGDLVLMDYAPDYGYYTSDIGRMWPINGKYNDWQRQLYQFILDYHKDIISRIRPGLTARQIMDDSKVAMEVIIQRTDWLKPIYEAAARRLVETGGGVFSHTVGMAVHDVGGYRRRPLRVGDVFSVDPQLRVPEENLYMRYEDTVAVTKTGVEVLTRFVPWELDELEDLVREEGLLQLRPSVAPVKK